MIEITKACIVDFMKARNSLVVQCRQKSVNWEKEETENCESIFFKALTKILWLARGSCSWFNKLFMTNRLSNRLHEKVMICH